MSIRNSEIADRFDELADLLSIENANQFRIRAYRNAAGTIRANPKQMADLVAVGEDLSDLPGIGKDLAAKVEELVETGHLSLLEEVAARTPRVLSEIMKIPGLGPKRVQLLHRELKVRSVADLERAATNGRMRTLPGFGARTEQLVLDGIKRLQRYGERFKLSTAEETAEPLVEYLKRCKGVKQITLAGSLRRRCETVGDIDILVTATRGSKVTKWFTAYEDVAEIISRGDTRASVRLGAGMNVDLRVVPQVSFGAALYYFTGSKAHNIAVRTLAAKKGYKINEYGVFRGERRVAGKTEREVFAKVGLDYVPPELREDRGEIAAARAHRLPKLIGLGDIRGDLHCHTHASDGHASIEAMAAAAGEHGYEYVSINDHSKHVTIAHGLDEKRLLAQIEAIDELNEKLEHLTVLKSAEVDILEDGSLDFPDRVLKRLDFTVCAIHYQFGLSEKKQTERILRAMDNPYFTILAHPTGRLINERAPYLVNLKKVLDHARKRRCYLEVNAHPDRLDLGDQACRMAKDAGVKVAISTDAHSPDGLGFMRFGVDQARRGWLGRDDVINCRRLDALQALFAKR